MRAWLSPLRPHHIPTLRGSIYIKSTCQPMPPGLKMEGFEQTYGGIFNPQSPMISPDINPSF